MPDLHRVIVPVGGGGLISGVAIAVKSQRPEVEVIGVQVQACAPFPASLAAGEPVAVASALTIADGIAVKRPGVLTLSLIQGWVDGLVVVSEEEVAEAMVFLLERAKLVVEGAGAVGVAALLAGRAGPTGAEGTTAVILSGGNVDPGLLGDIARRHESQAGRRHVLLARLPDRPGSLALLLSLVGQLGANLSTWSTSARALTSTCASRRSSSCWRPAGPSMPPTYSGPCAPRATTSPSRSGRRPAGAN